LVFRKSCEREVFGEPTWVKLDIDDCWAVGPGLDDCGEFRDLCDIAEKPKHLRVRRRIDSGRA
jgi:hypothetical protein